MEITGKVVKILTPQRFVSQRNGNEYVRNTFVIETSGQYVKKVAFSVMGEEKFAQMGIEEGKSYAVSFDVESREWHDKWFTECVAWKAVSLDANTQQGSQENGSKKPAIIAAPPVDASSPEVHTEKATDLPF